MIVRRAYKGKLNLDDDRYLVPEQDYTDARNISKDAKLQGYDSSVSSTVGNRKVNYTLPSGTTTTIGAYADLYRKRIIDFSYNSDGKHLIRIFDGVTRSFTKLLENLTDTNGVDILGFSATSKINSINVIHRDSSEGDLLLWTDGVPRKLNIDRILAGTYGNIEADFISAAKKMPLVAPEVAYEDDATRNTNNLRRKLYQFKILWIYDDYERSCWSINSDVPVPANLIGTDNDLDSSKNNCISVQLTTGNKDVLKIAVAVRASNGNTWKDWELADVLVKEDLGIADNGVYTYKFYNDGVFPAIDQVESLQLFDWLPRFAGCQEVVNGNVVCYAAITEGYNLLRVSDLDVTMTVENIKNTGVEAGPPSLTYLQDAANFNFTVSGSVPTGTYYRVVAFIAPSGPSGIIAEYTSVPGDTINDVAYALFNDLSPSYQLTQGGNLFTAQLPVGSFIVNVLVTPGSGSTSIAQSLAWNWNDKIRFGLVYFDEYGRTNGVVTYVNPTATDDDFEVNTPNFSQDGGTPCTPVISAEINHTPPSWAVRYMWVRTKGLTYESFLYYVTCDFQSDTDYYYFGLGNIDFNYEQNDKNIYESIAGIVGAGDRLKVLGVGSSGAYTSSTYTHDFEIVGIVERQLTGGVSSDVADFVKVKKPLGAPSPAFGVNMFVMVYRPAKSSNVTQNFYYEFGQSYEIYEDGGERYHRGEDQDQDAGQPATFTFEKGDVYYRQRNIHTKIVAPVVDFDYLLPDSNYNDFYASAVNGDGRAQAVDINAKELYYPTLIRFSQSYVADSNINGLSRFYYDNQDTYNRSYGDIMRLKERDKTLRVFQKLKVGMVPVFQQIIKDVVNGDVLAQSDQLLNKIQYYSGDFGIGDCPESLASDEFADYFAENYRGRFCRLSRDGITNLSQTYKINGWATEKLTARGATYKVYGVFDKEFNRYIAALAATGTDSGHTISFHEPSNGFEGFHDFLPEMMVNLGTLLCTYKNGELWTHDSGYCNFYGTQYKPSIKAVYNDGPDFKKTFTNLRFVANALWTATSVSTSLGQTSSVKSADIKKREDGYYAAFSRDAGSPGGEASGDKLKGNYIEVKLEASSGSVFNCLTLSSVKMIESNKNT